MQIVGFYWAFLLDFVFCSLYATLCHCVTLHTSAAIMPFVVG